MPPTMFQPRTLATSFAAMPSEGLVQMSGKGKLLDKFLSERRLVPVEGRTFLSGRCNSGRREVQRRSNHAESLVKRWSGEKSNAISAGFARSSFWSLWSADVGVCRGLCTSRVGASQFGGVVNAAAEAGERLGETNVVVVDQGSGSEPASAEAVGNGETDSSGERGADKTVSETDAAGND